MLWQIRLSDFNAMVGIGWNLPDRVYIAFEFGCTEDDGPFVTVVVKSWSYIFPLEDVWEGDKNVYFLLGDCRRLIDAIEPSYKNLTAPITFEVSEDCWEVIGGPGNGTKLEVV